MVQNKVAHFFMDHGVHMFNGLFPGQPG